MLNEVWNFLRDARVTGFDAVIGAFLSAAFIGGLTSWAYQRAMRNMLLAQRMLSSVMSEAEYIKTLHRLDRDGAVRRRTMKLERSHRRAVASLRASVKPSAPGGEHE